MKQIFSKKPFVILLLVIMVFVSIPQEAQARNLFRRFFHDFWRGTKFIVKLPDKATRWMGPVLGPIASTMLTQNIASHHKFGNFFRNAHRVNNAINDIEEQKKLTKEIKQAYRNQAKELREHVKKLEEARKKLGEQLLDRSISMSDYVKTAIDLDKMILTVKDAADRFDSGADTINTGNIIKLAANNLLENIVKDIKNVALSEVNNEIFSIINPDVIDILINQESSGLDAFLDLFISGNLENYNGNFNIDELRDRIKDKIKQTLKNNKDAFKDNMRQEMNNIIQEIMNNVSSESKEIKNGFDEISDHINDDEATKKKNFYSNDELAATLSEIPKDEFGCRPGYEWQRMSGVGCVQTNCSEVGGHYSYTKSCICSFVDPQPGALTKSCLRPSNYLSCPSCLYACVSPDADCPAR